MGTLASPRAFGLAFAVFAAASWALYASTLGGMGRDVGGASLVTAYTFAWLFAWPAAWAGASNCLENAGRARRLRRIGYVSAPLLYFAVAHWTPTALWKELGLEDVRFNYFGETLIFTQTLKACGYVAITALGLAALPRPGPTGGRSAR